MLVSDLEAKYEDITIITFDNPEMRGVKHRSMLLRRVSWSKNILAAAIVSGMISIPRIFIHMVRERPNVVITTGSGDLAIPAIIIARAVGIKTIYIETWTRVSDPSVAAKVLYHFSDVFLVQWEDMLNSFGKKAKYLGGLV